MKKKIKRKRINRHISKMDWGYWVRFYKDRKAIVSKIFKLEDYSRRIDCVKAARMWRDENEPPKSMFIQHVDLYADSPTKANKLGIVGVCIEKVKRKNSITLYARAYWGRDGGNFSKRFSISKYGEEKAIELAKNFREVKVREIVKENIEKQKNERN